MKGLSIGTKLIFLAGVPVIGALVLAALIAQGARAQAMAAAALGSIEDVAQLSMRIETVLHGLQRERARTALLEGAAARTDAPPSGEPTPGTASARGDASAPDLRREESGTDAALLELERFLAGRDLSKLPARLAKDLRDAREQVARLPGFRARIAQEDVPVDDILAFYRAANDALISATAALTQLSDDGALLRPISSLVALAELEERGSRQHALLSFVFASGQFPPGTFKTLVTLTTEQALFESSFRASAAEEQARRYAEGQATVDARAAVLLRDEAISETDDSAVVDANLWFAKEAARLDRLGDVEWDIVGRISAAAKKKMALTRSSIRTSVGLSIGVVFSSALLAWIVARGITRSIGHLSSAAGRVRETKDFSVRATKTTSDELGTLTDAFNEMLLGIQTRDQELLLHRTNLEAMVASRTAELRSRNRAMRLVLDNVDQGLTTIAVDGKVDKERSAAFDAWFGVPEEGASVFAHVSGSDAELRQTLEAGWGQVVDDVLPLELTLDQMPKRIERDGRHLTVGYKPILDDARLCGALLVVSDVTDEVEARAEQEKQREYIAVFERVTHDRDGFIAFVAETNRQLGLFAEGGSSAQEMMMALHTLKGNTAQWGIASVAKLAHELEAHFVETREMPTLLDVEVLARAWECVTDRFRALLGETSARVDVTRAEVDALLQQIRGRISHEEILGKLEFLKHEPTSVRFDRMVVDVERLARQLGKPRPTVVVDAKDVRLPASRFAPFWSSTVHLLRNMLDHGLESAAERLAVGKREAGILTFRSVATRDQFRLEFADDGRGVDWDTVRERAARAGLPSSTPADLERALFAGGVSTASVVTELSGRGVGLSAVAARCADLGGASSIESTPGKGTKFVFSFPRRGNEHSLAPPRSAPARAAEPLVRPPAARNHG